MKPILFYLLLIILFSGCGRNFSNEDDVKKWLSGKEFSSENGDYNTFTIAGAKVQHYEKLIIKFDGDKVQYKNCTPTTYSVSKDGGDYQVSFQVDCVEDSYFTIILKKNGDILTQSVIYNAEYAYDVTDYADNRPDVISKLDYLAHLKRDEVDGPKLDITDEHATIQSNLLPPNVPGDSAKMAAPVKIKADTMIKKDSIIKMRNRDIVENSIQPPIAFVKVSGGDFQMGSDINGQGANPVHTVQFKSFYISKGLVKQSQWKEIMGNNPSRMNICDDCAVTNVSWDDVQKFITKIDSMTNKHYRLPTEAEWEYAARGGNQSKGYIYSGSNDFNDIRSLRIGNELGIYDMTGILWQWCNDLYEADYYNNSPKNEPQGGLSGTNHVLRGGGFANRAENCTVTFRHYLDRADNDIGFRLALN